MLILILLFCVTLSIPIFLKREKQKRRVDAILYDVKKWKSQVKELEQLVERSGVDEEKLEMAQNRLSFAKNAYKVKMTR